jgi:hypothetical protein
VRSPDPLPLVCVLLVAGCVAFAIAWLRPLHSRAVEASDAEVRQVSRSDGRRATPSDWAARAPFRPARRPASVPYRHRTENAATPSAVAPSGPRPQLTLRGIVGGRTRIALVEGFPGTEGARALRLGDRIGELRLVSMDGVRVRIAGPDTAWTLVIGAAR